MKSLQGQLLIATNELRDPNFFHTVVFMVRHNDEGALGLVLNRPLKVRLRQVWVQMNQPPCERDDLIYLGGPCEGPLMALHDEATLGESEVCSGVHFCTNREYLSQLATDAARQARFFAGFAGWGPGQLEGEMSDDSWLVVPAKPDHIFNADPEIWEQVMRESSGQKILDFLNIRQVPPDLRMN